MIRKPASPGKRLGSEKHEKLKISLRRGARGGTAIWLGLVPGSTFARIWQGCGRDDVAGMMWQG
ncbi:MAG: hypothetical protein COW55_01305 [Rhodobacteraceae bacterium CG17_big_fil_post_rev_8_21_14_2_50_65_11]|nr:MAG: hypothetical protein COW55_01305 [Rhodobacteraceae bacterium CG17_big_fil_post_rev_8_21_14_2_50_65_11]